MNFVRLTAQGNQEEISVEYNRDKQKKDPSLIHAPAKRMIVKVTANDKYIITKCGVLAQLCYTLHQTYRRYCKNGIWDQDFYFKYVKHCHESQPKKVVIEVLYSDDNGYNILKKELELLQEHFGKKECLNMNNIPYIPKTTHAAKGSNWLKPNEYLNFMRLLKNYDY